MEGKQLKPFDTSKIISEEISFVVSHIIGQTQMQKKAVYFISF